MRIVVIYDNRRSEKLPLFQQELERQGIEEYEIFPAIVLKHDVVESISESFKEVIRQAKKNGDKEICILEDDITFPSENGWQYFINNKPKEFDVYVGGTYLIDNRINYEFPHVKIPVWTGNQCIIVNESYYDKWLYTDSRDHCDGAQSGLGLFYLCYPFAALQRAGSWSANHKNIVNYNNDLREEFIYR